MVPGALRVGRVGADAVEALQCQLARHHGVVGDQLLAVHDPEGDVTRFVLGSEAAGLGERWVDGEVTGVRIPMRGVADSLNVSVAAAVMLYEARRQRG